MYLFLGGFELGKGVCFVDIGWGERGVIWWVYRILYNI